MGQQRKWNKENQSKKLAKEKEQDMTAGHQQGHEKELTKIKRDQNHKTKKGNKIQNNENKHLEY